MSNQTVTISESERNAKRANALQRAREARQQNLIAAKEQRDAMIAAGVDPDMDNRPSAGRTITTPLTAIRALCLDCVCGSSREVELCVSPDCPVWPWRFGKRPETAAAEGKVVDRDAAKAGGAA